MLPALALPDGFPPLQTASLPATYEAAKRALAECERVDECATWAAKMEALASYARQAGDYELRKMCDRIQARAMKRAGELIRELKPQPGRRTDLEPENGGDPRTMKELGTKAGLSVRQHKTAILIDKIPDDQFESLMSSDEPPTLSALAELAKTPRPKPILASIDGVDQADRAASVMGQERLQSLVAFAAIASPTVVMRGGTLEELKRLRDHLPALSGWIARLHAELTA